ILTGNNSYQGTTSINAGTLQFGNGGASGTTGTGPIVDDSALVFNLSGPLTVANDISGTGTLDQNGTGTTILTGNNTYQGTTTISGGVLQVGNGGASGTLGTGGVVDDAILTFDRSGPLTVANVISGTGKLNQDGTGITILTGSNSYQGTTTISAGTLQVGNGGASGTLGTGAVVDNAALVLNRSGTLTIGGNISGTGTLDQNGTGTAILTGTNSYQGTTTISAGTLQIGNGGATGTPGTGPIVDNAALVFNRSNALTVANAISGTG